MSHLAAILATPQLRIVALVDPDAAMRGQVDTGAPEMDGVTIAESIDAVRGSADVVAICTPAETHAPILKQALRLSPRVVICEKPLAMDLATAREMVALSDRAGVELRINFHRRFNALHRKWRAKASGVPRAVTVRYGKGLWNYASHAVDLLLDWYGPVTEVRGLSMSGTGDPLLTFACRMSAGFDAVFVAIEGAAYDSLEIDIFHADHRIEMRGGGAEMIRYRPMADLYYRGYAHLVEDAEDHERAPVSGFAELYAAIAAHLHDGEPLPGCDGACALANMAILDAAVRSIKQDGAPMRPQVALGADTPARARMN